MRRRNFISILGGAAVTWPVRGRAQHGERTRRVGVLMGSPNDPAGQARLGAFLQALQEFGWAAGRNIQIDIRWSAGNIVDIHKYAAELVALSPAVILASGG